MATVQFVTGTLAKYKALQNKDDNKIYVISDAGRIYKGDKNVTSDVFYQDTVPTALTEDKIVVVRTSLNGKTLHDIYIGNSDNTAVKVMPGAVSDKESFNDEATFGAYVPTVSAVKGYVAEATSDTTDKANRAFVDASFENGSMKFSPANGSAAKSIELTGVTHDITWDADTYQLVVKNYGQDDVEINIPKDFFLQNGEYVAEHVFNEGQETEYTGPAIHLTVNINNGEEDTKKEIFIPVKELVDVYTVGNTDTVTLAMDAQHNITAEVKIAAGTSGIMIKTAQGIEATDKTLADISNEIDQDVDTAKQEIEAKLVGNGEENKIVISTATGVTRSEAVIGGAALADAPSASVLATERAVIDAISAGNTELDAKIDKEIQDCTTAVNNLDAAYKAADAEMEKAYKQADSDIQAAYKQADTDLHTAISEEMNNMMTWEEL